MGFRRTFLLSFLCAVLLHTLTSQVNHALAPWGLSLFVGGLIVVFPALRLPFAEGWKVVALYGLFHDSLCPVPFGFHAALYLCAFFFLFNLRPKVPREETSVALVLGLVTNAALYLAITVFFLWRVPAPASVPVRWVLEVLCSLGFTALLAPWYVAFHEAVLARCGVNLHQETRSFF